MKKLLPSISKRFGPLLLILVILTALFLNRHLSTPTKTCQSGDEQCWSDLVASTLRSQGLSAAFDLISHLNQTTPSFGLTCHSLTHQVGQKAYLLFSQKKSIALPPNSGLCDFGFYHGFMEALLSTTGDISQARSFCDYVAQESSHSGNLAPTSFYSCLHGIGHGTVDVHDSSLDGNATAMVQPAIKLCQQVAKTDHELDICASGVFNSIQIGIINREYGLKLNENDPFSLCRTQPDFAQYQCYGEMGFAKIVMDNLTLPQSISFINTIGNDSYANKIMINVSGDLAGRQKVTEPDHSADLKACLAAPTRLQTACVQGMVYGLLANGDLDTQFPRVTAICRSPFLSSDLAKNCVSQITDWLYAAKPHTVALQYCLNLEEKWQKLCR